MFSQVGNRLGLGCRRTTSCARTNPVVLSKNFAIKTEMDKVLEQKRPELDEDQRIIREEFDKLKGFNVRQAYEKRTNDLLRDYTNFYKEVSRIPDRPDWPASLFDKSPREQEAFMAYVKAKQDLTGPFLEKHGLANLESAFARLDALSAYKSDEGMSAPINVCVTGAAGQLGYALVFRIASGSVFGPKTPINLTLMEIPATMKSLEGVAMELTDCAFPLVRSVNITSDPNVAFKNVDYAALVGALPRGKGMVRADLIKANGPIFVGQGKALNEVSKGPDTRVLVVGNPANTNALIAASHAPSIPKENFSAMTRLDHNRGLAQLAAKLSCGVSDIENFVIWGNHSDTQFPDISHAKLNGQWLTDVIKDKTWLTKDFYPTVQKRGAAIIQARGLSSAASAASSAGEAISDWHFGTFGNWTSAAVVSRGEYGITKGLFYSYPVVYNDKKQYDIVRDLPITPEAAALMEASHQELLAEKEAIKDLLLPEKDEFSVGQ